MNKTIQAGQTLTARSICDHSCIFTIEVLSRKGNFATIKDSGKVKRCKVRISYDGEEYLMPEVFSMAPMYKASNDLNKKIIAFAL